MKTKIIIAFLIFCFAILSKESVPFIVDQVYSSNERLLSERAMSLENRYANKWVNEVFKDNILLTMSYLSGKVSSSKNISWNSVRTPFRSEIVLNPGDVFAFHGDVLPEYRGKNIKTTNANFGAGQGFRSSGLLYGDGVCHLASLINWAAKDAGLKVDSRVNHNFANIPEVPREYGTSIVTTGVPSLNAERQNLYVVNTFDKPVRMLFRYEQNRLSVSIYK
jgi:vancomycin resistance protein YoaR